MIYLGVFLQLVGSFYQNQNELYGPCGELLTRHRIHVADQASLNNPPELDSVQDFRPSVQIDDSTLLGCRGPHLWVLDDFTVYAILQSGPSSGLPRHIRFTSSSDTGNTWIKPNIIIRYDPDIIIMYPSLSIGDDGALSVVWTEPYGGGIYFSRSTDSGQTWTDTVSVDDDVPVGDRRYNPDIVCCGDTLIASWREGPSSGTNSYPYVAISTDDGAIWTNEIQISCVPPVSSGFLSRPYIRCNPPTNNFYVMWGCGDGEIYVARSSDGTNWQASIVTIDNSADAKYGSMDIGTDGTVYVVWTEARYGQYDTDIFLSKSTDNGVTWSGSILVNDQAGIGANQYEPHVWIEEQGIIHVAWIECIPFGNMTHAYYTISFDDGLTWHEPNLVVTDRYAAIVPSVPYTISCASDTSSHGYVGWVYEEGSARFNYFSTNNVDTLGIEEQPNMNPAVKKNWIGSTILYGPLHLPENKCCKIFDISGRQIHTLNPAPGVYFIEVDGEIRQKVIKIR